MNCQQKSRQIEPAPAVFGRAVATELEFDRGPLVDQFGVTSGRGRTGMSDRAIIERLAASYFRVSNATIYLQFAVEAVCCAEEVIG